MAPPLAGDPTAALLLYKSRCAALIDAINSLPSSKLSAAARHSLLRLAAAELRFLSRLPPSSPPPPSPNLPHISAILRTILHPHLSHVTRACRRPVSSAHADLVASFCGSPAWILVSARNPSHLSWLHHVRPRISHVLHAAASAPLSLRPDILILVFFAGARDETIINLSSEFGATELEFFDDDFEEVENDWVNIRAGAGVARVFEIKVFEDEVNERIMKLEMVENGHGDFSERTCDESYFEEVIGSMKSDGSDLVNFDTTALIAMVSGISNGSTEQLLEKPENEMRARFKSNYEFVIAQVMSELKCPILAELKALLAGKKGIICESVYSEYKDLVSMCGGPNENLRAHYLLKHLVVVKDTPAPRLMDLPTTRKIAMKNKIVFGTGDYWHSPTLTANMGFVRAISQTDVAAPSYLLYEWQHNKWS